ncbi:MAG: fatty acid desaturase [Chloroflexota bacterium]
MLRYTADLKTMLWLTLTLTLFFWQWSLSALTWWLYGPYLYFSIAIAVIVHNHNHVRIWKQASLNHLTDILLTLFYGFPVFGWIPTHNKNHHRHNNTKPDYTRTWRYWEGNSLFTLLTYPAISAYHQQKPIQSYVRHLYSGNKTQFYACLSQIVCLLLWIGVALLLDWRKALLLVIIPQQVSLSTVLCINYLQHVHADEEHAWNHSRNFTGPVLNFFMFNNGYHTVHHKQPALHWSKAPAAHKKIVQQIDPALNEPMMIWYLIRVYILGLIVPAFKPRSMRLKRMQMQHANKGAYVHKK